MTLADAEEIFAYWAENPPAHLMLQTIAAMLGWKPRVVGSLDAIAAIPPPGLEIARDGTTAMPAAIFDIAKLRAVNQARAAAHHKSE